MAILILVKPTTGIIPCQVDRTILDRNIHREQSSTVRPTLGTSQQNTYRGANTLTWDLTDVDDGVGQDILIASQDCDTSEIYLGLRLITVSYFDVSSQHTTEIDSSEFSDYNLLGGINQKDVPRGEYSPAYLTFDPTQGNFGTKLLIDTSEPSNLPSAHVPGRIYYFEYLLTFESRQEMMFVEKR